MNKDRADKLYAKAVSIREESARGFWVPLMRHLAMRGHSDAMIDLASWYSKSNAPVDLGTPADAFSGAGLYRRAFRKKDMRAAQHMAMVCFNRNDLKGYRQWLHFGAKGGDAEAAFWLRNFETRLPHGAAKEIRRARPEQRRDNVT